MSTIEAIAFRRNQMQGLRADFPEIEHTGVYILLGATDDGDLTAYIGQSESVWGRLARYNAKGNTHEPKDFWTDTIVLVSKDENLTGSHARYVEARLICEAANNPRWNLPNVQRPSDLGKLPLPERAAMDEFVDQAVTLAGALGCDIFRTIRGPAMEQPNAPLPASRPDPSPGDVFNFRGEGFAAEMYVSTSGEFVVTHGSRARIRTTPTVPKGTVTLRETLVKHDVLKEESGAFIFNRDYSFSSVSSAAALVTGASANGRISWRLPDGRTYADWEESQTADTTTDPE